MNLKILYKNYLKRKLSNKIFMNERLSSSIDDNLSFIHLGIAHTGQNTQLKFFQDLFKDDIFIFGTTPEIKINYEKYLSQSKKNFKVFHVHACCPIHNLIKKKLLYVSFLRDPISCMMSTIFSGIRMSNDQKLPSSNKILEEKIHWHLDNAFSLKGHKKRYLLLSRFFLAFNHNTFDNINEWPPKKLEPGGFYENYNSHEILDLIKKIINKYFLFLGFTEKFNESIFLLLSLINFKRFQSLPKWNHLHVSGAPHYSELSESLLDRFKEILSIDISLYEYCLNQFNSNYSSYLDELNNIGFNLQGSQKKITKTLV